MLDVSSGLHMGDLDIKISVESLIHRHCGCREEIVSCTR